jgi:hypothetical protein
VLALVALTTALPLRAQMRIFSKGHALQKLQDKQISFAADASQNWSVGSTYSAEFDISAIDSMSMSSFVYIPDSVFKAFCVSKFDTNADGEISYEEAAAATDMTCLYKQIKSFEGLQYFVNLDSLNIKGDGEVTSLNFSTLTKLTKLRCEDLQHVTSLDLSHCTELVNLYLMVSAFQNVDLSANTKLEHLDLSYGNLRSLDLSHCTELRWLNIGVNSSLPSIDVSKNTKLTYFASRNNNIATIDLSKNEELDFIWCPMNKMSTFVLGNKPKLKRLICFSNYLTHLDVSTFTNLTEAVVGAQTKPDGSDQTILVKLGTVSKDVFPSVVDGNASSYKNYNTHVVFDAPQNSIYVSDPSLGSYILSNFDANKDGEISPEEAQAVTTIDCSGKGITSLEGLDKFPNLTTLYCQNNNLSVIELSNMPLLKVLDCSGNPSLGEVDPTELPDLEVLNCDSTGISQIDVSKNPKLQTLNVGNTDIGELAATPAPKYAHKKNAPTSGKGLNVTKNGNLVTLICNNCHLDALDLSNCSMLDALNCADNKIAELDLTKNTKLLQLKCCRNRIKSLNLGECSKLEWAKVGGQTDANDSLQVISVELERVMVSVLPNLNVVGGENYGVDPTFYESYMFADPVVRDYVMEHYDTDKNTILSFSEVNRVDKIDCAGATSLADLRYFPNITYLQCYNSKVTDVDFSHNPKLQTVSLGYDKITKMDLSGLKDLTTLVCPHNQLTELDLSHNPKLKAVNCSNNQLADLDVSQLPNLDVLTCTGNRLTRLDLSKNTVLTYLACYENRMASINLSANTHLTSAYIGYQTTDGTTPRYISVALGTLPESVLDSLNRDLDKDDYDYGNLRVTIPGTQKITFDDPNFKAYLVKNFDTNADGEISAAEASVVEKIQCHSAHITHPDQLQYFTSLGTLDLMYNDISSIDLGTAPSLRIVNLCNNPKLTSLDVKNNQALLVLQLNEAGLTTLDVSNNTNLIDLECSSNRLTSLNVSQNAKLKSLMCSHNAMRNIDISADTLLETAYVGGQIDATGSAREMTVELGEKVSPDVLTNESTTDNYNNANIKFNIYVPNSITRAEMIEYADADKDGKISNTEAAATKSITLTGNNIGSLNLLKYFTGLDCLLIAGGVDTVVDLSGMKNLEYLQLDYVKYKNIDLSGNTNLKELRVNNCPLTTLNLAPLTQLETLCMKNTKIASLDVSHNTGLLSLDCHKGELSELKVDKLTQLIELACYSNHIRKIDISKNTQLKEAYVGNQTVNGNPVYIDVILGNNVKDTVIHNPNQQGTGLEYTNMYVTLKVQ